MLLNPLPDDKFFYSSKLIEFADDNFKFDEYGRRLSKPVENTVGKGEIARTSNFSFSHTVFKRLVSQGRQKVSLCGNDLKHDICIQMIENIVEKGANFGFNTSIVSFSHKVI